MTHVRPSLLYGAPMSMQYKPAYIYIYIYIYIPLIIISSFPSPQTLSHRSKSTRKSACFKPCNTPTSSAFTTPSFSPEAPPPLPPINQKPSF